MTRPSGSLGSAILAVTFVGGACTQAPTPQRTSEPAAASQPDDHGHVKKNGDHDGHQAGPHDGAIAEWGNCDYHVEFTVDHDTKEAVIYVLDSDGKTPAPVKTSDGKLLLTIREPAFQVELAARPLTGEAKGTASRYGGTHENLGIVRQFAGTISGEVDGTPYAGEFAEESPDEHGHE